MSLPVSDHDNYAGKDNTVKDGAMPDNLDGGEDNAVEDEAMPDNLDNGGEAASQSEKSLRVFCTTPSSAFSIHSHFRAIDSTNPGQLPARPGLNAFHIFSNHANFSQRLRWVFYFPEAKGQEVSGSVAVLAFDTPRTFHDTMLRMTRFGGVGNRRRVRQRRVKKKKSKAKGDPDFTMAMLSDLEWDEEPLMSARGVLGKCIQGLEGKDGFVEVPVSDEDVRRMLGVPLMAVKALADKMVPTCTKDDRKSLSKQVKELAKAIDFD